MMTRTKNYRMKAVVVGSALVLILGAGAASASGEPGADVGHGANVGVGHVRNGVGGKAVKQVRRAPVKAAVKVQRSVKKTVGRLPDTAIEAPDTAVEAPDTAVEAPDTAVEAPVDQG